MKARAPWIVLTLLAILAVHHWAWPALTQTHWYKVNVQDDTYFYRMKVGLSHKGTPIDFDVVVGCGVRVSEDRYSGASIDILGWYPFVYAKEIPGGHAVMIRTTVDGFENAKGGGPCLGITSARSEERDGTRFFVRRDWLPLLVWYDRADDLSHGLAYVTQDAYESPAAQLEFHGATIERATRADFDRFMATAPRNLVPAYNAGSLTSLSAPSYKAVADIPPEVVANPRLAWPMSGMPFCRGVERIRLNEAQRAKVRALWPEGRPQYWSVPPKDQLTLRHALFDPTTFGQELFRYSEPDIPEQKARRPEVYPLIAGFTLARLNEDTGEGGYDMDVEIGDGLSGKGMMSCDVEADDILEEAVTGRQPHASAHHANRVCRVEGVIVPAPPDGCAGGNDAWWIAFENDEYAIMSSDLSIIIL